MRQFGPRASRELEEQIRREAQELYDMVPEKREVKGEVFVMEGAEDQVVIREADIRLPDGNRMRIAMTEPSARPPFEWLVEITSDIGESDYFKHYLVREDDIMMAQRKELTHIDEPEAKLILQDLAVARAGLA